MSDCWHFLHYECNKSTQKFLIQFRYANSLDVLMIVAGVLFSIISGFSTPAESFLIGQFFTILTSFDSAQSISTAYPISNCSLSLVQDLLNRVATNNSDQIFCDASRKGNVINSASEFVCDPDQTLTDQLTTVSLRMLYLAILTFVAELSTYMLWSITASRNSKQMRISFYKAVLKNNISWFDTNDVSELGPTFLE